MAHSHHCLVFKNYSQRILTYYMRILLLDLMYGHTMVNLLYWWWWCRRCVDIDECSFDLGGCDKHASCNNTDGSYSCVCQSGYQGNGIQCTGSPYFSHPACCLVPRGSVVQWLGRWTLDSTVASSVPGRSDKYWNGWPSSGGQTATVFQQVS